jgi:hypothetical protein
MLPVAGGPVNEVSPSVLAIADEEIGRTFRNASIDGGEMT